MIRLWVIFLLLLSGMAVTAQGKTTLSGAWQNSIDPGETICMMDGYFVYSKFDVGAKTFDQTWGGPYTLKGNMLHIKVEFDSKEKDHVGKERVMPIKQAADLTIEGLGAPKLMKQVDAGNGPVAAAEATTSGNACSGRLPAAANKQAPTNGRLNVKVSGLVIYRVCASCWRIGRCGGGRREHRCGQFADNLSIADR